MPGSQPSVLVTRRVPSAVMARLQAACTVDLHRAEAPISPDDLRARIRDKQALICLLTDTIDRGVIDAAPSLRIVANVAVGYDNIDVAYARSRGIVVTNTPGVLTEAVAELTWALILTITRRIAEGERLVRAGGWKGWALDFMLGSELTGKQLGVVGLGRIGRAVARRAPAFGMRVVGASRQIPLSGGPEPMHQNPAGGLDGVRLVSLDELLVTSDVVTLHVPLTASTRHLIDQRSLARMKRSAYLVNSSRGAVVDEAALAWALHERLIAGAALDVYEVEPAINPDLFQCENVVLAPHLGSATVETRTAMADLAASNVLAVLSGQPPLTPVPVPEQSLRA